MTEPVTPTAAQSTDCAFRAVMVDTGYESYEQERKILEPLGGRFEEVYCEGDAARILEAAKGKEALLVREAELPRELLLKLDKLKVIVRYGAGIDNIDLATAGELGIYVANVPDYGFEEVSDHALALYLALTRRLNTRDPAVRSGRWNVAREEPIYRTRAQTLGIVGFGRIGRAFHRKAQALGFRRILVHTHNPVDLPGDVEACDLDTLCAESSVVSLHLPLTPETRHVIDARRIAMLGRRGILLNTSRGGLIDEDALAAALNRGELLGAGLDVFEQEPIHQDNPLLHCPNTILTDHAGWYSEEALVELQSKAATEIARVMNGEEPAQWVNKAHFKKR